MYTTIFQYLRCLFFKGVSNASSSSDTSIGKSSQIQLSSEADPVSEVFPAPPPFFRNSLVLVLVLFCAGCSNLDDFCLEGIPGFINRLRQAFPFFPFWLLLGIQSAVIGFLLTSVASTLLYRIQIRKQKGWEISRGDVPPMLPVWAIPVILLGFLILPFLVFLGLVFDCPSSYRWSQSWGAFLGCIIGWGIIFQFYFLRKIRKLRNIN